MRLLVVRHASAGDRSRWKGDDRLRPLDRRGRRQAEGLVTVLDPIGQKAAFWRAPILVVP